MPSSERDHDIVQVVVDDSVVVTLSRSDCDRFDETDRRVTFECASGAEITGRWRGIALGTILENDAIPPETTHLLVVARDGHHVCLDIATAANGLLAFERSGGTASTEHEFPRIVIEGLAGPRTIKLVDTIRPVVLTGEDRPDEFETLPPSAVDT